MFTADQHKNADKRIIKGALLFFLLIPLLINLQACSIPFPGSSDRSTGKLPSIKAVQVDLDYVYDKDLQQQKQNITLLVQRIKKLGVNTVFLQAFADPDGNGVAESLYFPNRFMPLRENLFSPTAKLLRQNGITVFGWLPLLAFSLPGNNNDLYVHKTNDSYKNLQTAPEYARLSPFNSTARKSIEGIYLDFTRETAVDGILFHDDGILSDFEDNSEAALQEYVRAGFPADIEVIHNNRATMQQWSRYKTKYLTDFSLTLLDIVRQFQPNILSARNIFAGPILQPESEKWFAQSLPSFLRAYDYVALMAMPFMEKATDSQQWLERLSWAALSQSGNSDRIIFELQSKNWITNNHVPPRIMRQQIVLLHQLGVTSLAYYPDDFYNNMPPAEMISSCLSGMEACKQQ
jgi:biofilm PGA synthesis lipoprotein PgaB